MSGGNQWFSIYYDPQYDVYIKVDYYHAKRLHPSTHVMLSGLELKEERLIECPSRTAKKSGNTHCVRYSYPKA